MDFTVLNWNIGGAKLLEKKTRGERKEVRDKLNEALRKIIHDTEKYGPKPDVVTLQEIVRYREPDHADVADLIGPIDGYEYVPFTLIDSHLLSSRAKWNKIVRDSDWPKDTFFAQGNAFLFKTDAPRFGIWDLSHLGRPAQANKTRHCVENVHLDSGLYFGDRNTEPRAALVAHFIYDPGIDVQTEQVRRQPLDIFVVNVHLTTLMKEREGVPEIDAAAARVRQAQLDIVFYGIVSRYNSWRRDKYPERGERRSPGDHENFDRYSPVWIITGDFNFTEDSEEYVCIRRMNFIDVVHWKVSAHGTGTKASGFGNDPTLNLDYVFAGPKFVSLNPLIERDGIESKNNRVIHEHEVRASDHYPTIATVPLNVSSLSDGC